MAQCVGLTKKGEQCKKNAIVDGQYCNIHLKSINIYENTTIEEDKEKISSSGISNLKKLLNENHPLALLLMLPSVFIGAFLAVHFFKGDSISMLLFWFAFTFAGCSIGFALDTIFKSIFGTEKYLNFMEVSGGILYLLIMFSIGSLGAYIGFSLGDHWYSSITFAIIGFIIGVLVVLPN